MIADTWHDQRPTHPVRPDWLDEADYARSRAWIAFHEAANEEYATDHPNQDRIDGLFERAHMADLWYYDCYEEWSRGTVPASLMAQIEQRVEEEIPFHG